MAAISPSHSSSRQPPSAFSSSSSLASASHSPLDPRGCFSFSLTTTILRQSPSFRSSAARAPDFHTRPRQWQRRRQQQRRYRRRRHRHPKLRGGSTHPPVGLAQLARLRQTLPTDIYIRWYFIGRFWCRLNRHTRAHVQSYRPSLSSLLRVLRRIHRYPQQSRRH